MRSWVVLAELWMLSGLNDSHILRPCLSLLLPIAALERILVVTESVFYNLIFMCQKLKFEKKN